MLRPKRFHLDLSEIRYLASALGKGSALKKKQILQYICRVYRKGANIRPSERIELELLIIGLLNSGTSDEKIRRWALAALQHVGSKEVSTCAILKALKDYPDEPQVQAAAIATLFHFDSDNAYKIITDIGSCTPTLITLAALQTTRPESLNLSDLSINIETADTIELKLALLLVGLNKSPENLFHPKHENAKIIKALGSHHEQVVSQYTIWAAAENPELGVKDIGIPLKDIEAQVPNVRSYMYRLIATDIDCAQQNHEIIELGTHDSDDEARTGLAIGLRDCYYDGLDPIVIDWYYDEQDNDIKDYVLDHIVVNSVKCPNYEYQAIEEYNDIIDCSHRLRMEAAASKTPLFMKFKQIQIESESGKLLDWIGEKKVNNTFNINGNIGSINQTDISNNCGTVINKNKTNNVDIIKDSLLEIRNELTTYPIKEDLKNKAIIAINDAFEKQNIDSLKNVKSILSTVKGAISTIGTLADNAKKIGEIILLISNFL